MHYPRIIHTYYDIKEKLINSGYADEIDWQYELSSNSFDQHLLLQETAWVILSSGFYEGTIRKVFPNISSCFYDWIDILKIVQDQTECISNALTFFGNRRKIAAIAKAADIIHKTPIETIKNNIEQLGPQYLTIFPYIGETTCYHLAKNLGYNTPKPDRHLQNIANLFGFSSTFSFCKMISKYTGDPTPEVDIVFWRYANLNGDYLDTLISPIDN